MKKYGFLVIILLLLPLPGWSCWVEPFSYGYERREFTFLNNHLLNDIDYISYLDDEYHTCHYCESADSLDENLLEWEQYFEKKIPLAAISQAVYDLSLSTTEQALAHLEQGKTVEKYVLENPMIAYLVQNREAEILRYLVYAKKCEVYSTFSWYQRDKESTREDIQPQKIKLTKEVHRQCLKTKNPFLRLRYAFQAVRTAFYAGQWKECIDLYEQLIKSTGGKSHLQRKAAGYMAGALTRLKKVGEAKAVFADLYYESAHEKDPSYRRRWFFNFYYVDPKDELACSGGYNANCILLDALRNRDRGVWSLYRIEEIQPGSVASEVLLLREVKKAERWYLSTNFKLSPRRESPQSSFFVDEWTSQKLKSESTQTSFWDRITGFFSGLFKKEETKAAFTPTVYDRESEKYPAARPLRADHINDLKQFIEQKLKTGKMRQPVLWYLCAAYLEILQKNNAAARLYLDKADRLATDQHFKKQIWIFEWLLKINDPQKTIDQSLEDQFSKELNWLNDPAQQRPYRPYSWDSLYWKQSAAERYQSDQNWQFDQIGRTLMAAVGQKCLAQEDIAKAALCFYLAKENFAFRCVVDIYASQSDLERLKELISKPKKTDFEKFLLKNFPLNANQITEIQATRLMREGQFLAARNKFDQLPMLYWSTKNREWDTLQTHPAANSFNFLAKDKPLYLNKINFAYHIVSLEHKAQTQPAQADRHYFEMANLFFNTPFWGYNGVVWNGSLVDDIQYYDDDAFPLNVEGFATRMHERKQEFLEQYGTRFMAQKYYQKVIELTKDKELKLRAIALAAQCNKVPLAAHIDWPVKNLQQADSVYKAMFQKEMTPELYEKLVRECPGIKSFQ